MLSARDLSIHESHNDYWERYLAKDSRDNFMVVARLLGCYKLEISGRFDMVKLSPRTLYEVVFKIKLEDSCFQCGGPVNIKLTQSEGIIEERYEDLERLPIEIWIDVLAGEFTTRSNPIGDLKFSLYKYSYNGLIKGLLVKGVTIRPKA